ncbi:uncharacterized protein LOC112501654 [Cynara cardunculus var. scolymus]|uniref:uncharacterized protein LOC112501654 n=1 Tax=Cynara cardunculus var. scolymus TaxID=59895 RepID=UPI000D628E37|nr:uncharacterized protein LOC112501654 [Cynara cardunculus var. scolymus]XP_024961116.1 uncharacterized protein LOC112501654 [Cynara cardunculus var. scolymus]XP_024961117.1 uncharacterized protein LOC112501654 [Cynara cardunculus var. scolymus]
MADKQLNFNRPLLSVRRFSSPVASEKDSRRKNESSLPEKPPIPSYKPESHSGSLRNPGSVPFVWEHSPGRPKDEAKTQKNPKERPPVVPKLPPGRILKHKKQDLDKKTEDSNAKKGPRKNSLGSQSEEKLTKFESPKGTKKVRSDARPDDEDGNSEIYMESDVKQSGIHFLPSAKAMSSEMTTEKPLEVKKVVNRENEKPQLSYGPNFLQFTADDSEEDSDFDYDDHENMSYKVCGLLPHFCLKGSIGLLNPVPGLSVRTRLPISSANKNRDRSSSVSSQPARVAVYEHKSSVNHQEDQMVLKNESAEATNQKKFQKLEGSGLYDRLQDRGVSYNLTASSPLPVSEREDGNFQKKGLVSFKELLLAEKNEKESDCQQPAMEKTLYVDTIHKVETAKSSSHSSSPKGKSNFDETDVGTFEISDIPTKSLQLDLVADKPKQDKEMKTQMGFCKDLKVSRQSGLELPATPPLPKSPSDSWLWRTLPSVSSKTASLRSNPKYSSPKIAARLDKNVQLRHPQGLLLPIPETL